jgi:aspartyl/asparaginyl beta-hydroxylase (cupin superfamily)
MLDPNINFYDESVFPFLNIFKNNYDVIYKEYLSAPIHTISSTWKDNDIHNDKWDVIGLRYQKEDFPEHTKLFPQLCSIYNSLPVEIETIGFSILKPKCEIFEHVNDNASHIANNLLRGHFCLTTNPKAALVVNGEIKTWQPGNAFVFDDKKRHSAYNRGVTPRINILFDFHLTK